MNESPQDSGDQMVKIARSELQRCWVTYHVCVPADWIPDGLTDDDFAELVEGADSYDEDMVDLIDHGKFEVTP